MAKRKKKETPADAGVTSAAVRYKELEKDRQGPLDRARKNATLTLPWVMPPDGADEQTDLVDPFQNVGGQGVRHLSSKMTLAVFPPNEPFFRHDVDEFVAEEAEAEQPGTKDDAILKLAKYDRVAMKRIEAAGDRPKVELAMKHLLVSGNVLVDLSEDKARIISLDNYVILRDPVGNVLECIFQEAIGYGALPEGVQSALAEKNGGQEPKSSDVFTLYTHYYLSKGKYLGYQEVDGIRVDGSDFDFDPEDNPYMALRFIVVDGMSYGRSFVEDMFGDIQTLETLTQAITDAASMASKVVFLVRTNGMTRVYDLKNAANGDFVPGDANDVTTLQLDKSADMRIARETAIGIEDRLKEQFLMRQSATRNAERVTAEEIRYVALEIEDALSGIYSLLSQEFQLPYARIKIKRMKDLPALPKDVIKVTITTGLEALRRGHDLQKLTLFATTMRDTYGPEALAQVLPPSSFAARLVAAIGLDIEGLVTNPQVANQNQAASELTSAAISATPALMKGALQNGQSPAQVA